MAKDLFTTITDYGWLIALFAIIIFGIIFMKYNRWSCFDLKESVHLMSKSEDSEEGVSALESFFMALSTRMGAGNIVGVAVAIIVGGVGSIFWMWVFSIFGASLCFAECTLGQIFKEKADDGIYRGGPAFYAERGLKMPKFAIFISLMFVVAGVIFAGVESCNMNQAIMEIAPDSIIWVNALIIAAVILFFVTRSMKKISKVLTFVTPFVAGVWIFAVLAILVVNFQEIPATFGKIFEAGFNFQALTGGLMGSFIIYGFRRGCSSCEGGTGMVASVASVSDDRHPVVQGYVQSLGVFVDIFLICTASALLLLSCGGAIPTDADEAVDYLARALSNGLLGNTVGPIFASVVLIFITFGTMLGLYALTEANARYVFWDNKKARYGVIALFVAVVFILAMGKQAFVWQLVDLIFVVMIACNIYCLWRLRPYLSRAVNDYKRQKKEGVSEPEFDVSAFEGLDVSGVTEWDRKKKGEEKE